MTIEEVFQQLKALLPTSVLSHELTKPDSYIKVEAGAIHEIANVLRDRLGFESLSCLGGTDYPKDSNISLTYHFVSYSNRIVVAIKSFVSRDGASVPSLTDLFKAADWLERETYDMLGVRFENHPDHRRILMPEDWEGFPLRKDFITPDYYNNMPVPLYFDDPPGGHS